MLVVLLCSAFIRPATKPDTTPVLDLIPTKAIDALLSAGTAATQPPPPAPPLKTPDQPPPPAPAPPTAEVKHVEPAPAEPVKPPETTEPEVTKPEETPKPPKHVVTVDLTKKVTRNTPKPTDESAAEAEKAAEKAAKEAQRLRDQRAREIQRAANNILNNESSSTEVNLPGNSSESYANYGVIVVSVYHQRWVPPENMNSESAVVNFTVTIARDGSVISSHITSPSGDPNIDRAVQRMLDRVTFIHEFPEDTKDRERTYHIDFNATRTNIQ
ncbi:MAG: TonB family protein [Verrucomicrobiota bacterium]